MNSERLLELLEHQGWVRDLARRLVRDPALADDVAQSVWVSALEHGPSVPVKEDSGLLRSWLGTVTRNAARQLRRSESRRADHEARAASRSEGRLPSAAELVERSALNRRVAEAVERLGEPYSSTLLLRFFEGLPPREIARRQGVPVETVRTRLTRGIATLRSSLDEEFGDRGTWMAALAPLAGLRLVPSAPQTFPSEVSGPAESLAAPSLPLAGEVAGPVSTAAIGAALMNTKLLLSIVGASAVGLGAWLATRSDAEVDAPVHAAAESVASPALAAPGPDSPSAPAFAAPSAEERVAVEPSVGPESPAPAPVAAAPALEVVVGRVLGPDARGLAGVRVGPEGEDHAEYVATSTGGGRFELALPSVLDGTGARLALTSWDATWVTVFGSAWRPGHRREPVLVVAPRTALTGTVEAEDGARLAEVAVSAHMPKEFRSRFDLVLDDVQAQSWSGTTDAAGAFTFAALPLVEGAELMVQHRGYRTWRAELSEYAGGSVAVVLERQESPHTIAGRVVDHRGVPVEGATVQFGMHGTVSAADGSFTLQLSPYVELEGGQESSILVAAGETESLIAVAPGLLPAMLDLPSEGPWPESITLTLPGEPFALGGVVLDHRGEPLPGAQVWVLDPTPLGQAWSHQEAVMSGSRSQWTEVAVDDDGEFLLEGLLDREYRLRAIDTETLVMGDFGPFHARRAPGRELSLTLATDQVFPLVSGRVVSLDGEPLEGISVHPQCDPQVMTRGAGRSVRHRSTAGTVTDDDGYFELTSVPRSLVYLRLDGEGILPLEFGRVSGYGDSAEKSGLPHDAVTELEIEVVQRAHLRVVLSNPGSADTFSVLDAAGETVPLHLIRANGHSTSGSMPIHSEGRSDVIALAETGAVVVLHAGVVEVGRAPVELVPGEVVDVTF